MECGAVAHSGRDSLYSCREAEAGNAPHPAPCEPVSPRKESAGAGCPRASEASDLWNHAVELRDHDAIGKPGHSHLFDDLYASLADRSSLCAKMNETVPTPEITDEGETG